jgi:hypothetical protein
VLVKVTTNKEVPPALMVLGVNVLETMGALTVTGSLSKAEHAVAVQPAATLVLVTFAGVVIDAVLVICVCAVAASGKHMASSIKRAKTLTPSTLRTINDNEFMRPRPLFLIKQTPYTQASKQLKNQQRTCL